MRKVILTTLGFALLVIYPFLALLLAGNTSLVSGFFVPDGVTLFNQAVYNKNFDINSVILSTRANVGEALLYRFLVGINVFAPIVLNISLLCMSWYILLRKSKFSFAYISLFLPFYLVASPLPSKDILVLFLFATILYSYVFINKFKFIYIGILILLLYFIRDGFALVLLMSYLIITFVKLFKINTYFAILSVIFFSASFWFFFKQLFGELFLISRSLGVAKQSEVLSVETSTSFYGYFIKVFGNSTNLAFRPAVIDEAGGLYLLAVAFWISGVTLLCAIILFIKGLHSVCEQDRNLSLLAILVILLVSVAPFVQPRYLLPLCIIIPLLSFVNIKSFVYLFLMVSVASIAAALIYILMDFFPQNPIILDFNLRKMLYVS